MVLFKLSQEAFGAKLGINLHSTMVLFKLKSGIGTVAKWGAFTFHYGPIQIFTPSAIICIFCSIYIPLWSYSNLLRARINKHLRNLHSTMVLFKCNSNFNSSLDSLSFTFHYGPIQIISHLQVLLYLFLFTFHYGPIQIKISSALL